MMVALLAFCTYGWVYYQPLMNKRLNVSHCNGAFAGES
jgi:hypothetical protein